MNGLKMHWRLIQESDGRRHLNMHWEPTHSCRIRSFARAQIHKNAKSHARAAKHEGCAQLEFTATLGVKLKAEWQSVRLFNETRS